MFLLVEWDCQLLKKQEVLFNVLINKENAVVRTQVKYKRLGAVLYLSSGSST